VTTDEIVQYIVLLRSDLKLPKGKAIAQGGHAVQLAIRVVERSSDPRALGWLAAWESGSYTKIALKADVEEIRVLTERLDAGGVLYARVVDEGRTVVEPGTLTAVGLQPMPRSRASTFVASLGLY